MAGSRVVGPPPTVDPSTAAQPLLSAEGVHKSYGGVRALRGASLTLRPGEIHGLIGENGSGKSTLLGIISGHKDADAGVITLGGRAAGTTLRQAVAVVTQELTLAPDLSVAENILLSHDKPKKAFRIDWKELNRRGATALARLGLNIDPRTPVHRLPVDMQQLVEIARAVEQGAPVLILDEPTSSLTEDGVAALGQTMRRLRDAGTAVVLVSHKLDEMFEYTERMTVLRDGATVLDAKPTAELDSEALIEAMLGYAPEHYAPPPPTFASDAAAVIELENVGIVGSVENVSFSVCEGEVVGLVGLTGSGRSELLAGLFGGRQITSGRVTLGGKDTPPRSPADAMARGVGYVPPERKVDGLILDMSIRDNIALASTSRRHRLRRRNRKADDDRAGRVAERLRIQRGSHSRPVRSLSGGNQQKVLLGRWIETDPTLLLLDEPTRGVDVGAKREIHRLIHDLRDGGMSVVVSSTDVDELMVLCDRFLVMFRGRLVAELARDNATEAQLSHLAAGALS